MTCESCGQVPPQEEIEYHRGYYWHKACGNADQFPREGKLIPDSILTEGA